MASCLDDIKVPGVNDKVHLQNIKIGMQELVDNVIRAHWYKCEFLKVRIKYYSHTIEA